MRQASRFSVTLGQLSYLDMIRGFVAVGRRMSITLAAEDLHLTQSAVSRQVRTLEEMLGVKLLVRGHRSISLTEEGERLFRCGDEAIKQLQDVIGTIHAGLAARPVTIVSSIGVAGLWLVPRLNDLLRKHPNVDVRISAGNELSDLRSEEFDLAIRYCPPEAVSQEAIRLFGETVAPVVHPSQEVTVLETPKDLEAQVLLEFDGEYRPWLRWNEWLAKQGWGEARPKAFLRIQSIRPDGPSSHRGSRYCFGSCRTARTRAGGRTFDDGKGTAARTPHFTRLLADPDLLRTAFRSGCSGAMDQRGSELNHPLMRFAGKEAR